VPDILLTTINAKWIHPSLALRLLRANLGALEGRSEIMEFALRQPPSAALQAILEARPRILGLSVSIWNHEASLALLRSLGEAWRASGERPLVVLGGPEASNLDDGAPLLAHCDYLVRGEGELAFRELCESYFEGREPRCGPAIERIRSVRGHRVADAAPVKLDTIDPGYRLYTPEDLERKLCYVEASRGCPFGCEFCLSSLDRRVRDFPLEAFLGYMGALLDRGAQSFKFLDRSFNLDAARAAAIMEFFLSKMRPDLVKRFFTVHFEILPSLLSPALLELAARFPRGSLRLELGIQTLDPRVAATVGRKSDPDLELETIRFLRERTEAIVHADLIAGLPGESLEGFGGGFDQLLSAGPEEIQVGMLKRLPGTALTRHDLSHDMRYAAEAPYEVISTGAMAATEIASLRNFARFWELIANRGNYPEFMKAFQAAGANGAFARFLLLSEALLSRFGRNWGIDRAELRAALAEWAAKAGSGAALNEHSAILEH
jgi:radical SAM superfamily enzyme YgiQ (UPF0313 family)